MVLSDTEIMIKIFKISKEANTPLQEAECIWQHAGDSAMALACTNLPAQAALMRTGLRTLGGNSWARI